MIITICIAQALICVCLAVKLVCKDQEILMSESKVKIKEDSNYELWSELDIYKQAIKNSNETIDKLVSANKKHTITNNIIGDKLKEATAVIDEIWDDFKNSGFLRDSIFDYYKLIRNRNSIEYQLSKLPTPNEAPGELSDDEPSIHEKLAELEANTFMEV